MGRWKSPTLRKRGNPDTTLGVFDRMPPVAPVTGLPVATFPGGGVAAPVCRYVNQDRQAPSLVAEAKAVHETDQENTLVHDQFIGTLDEEGLVRPVIAVFELGAEIRARAA